MTFKTIDDFDMNGRAVLLRADLNVPAAEGKVTDTTRIDRLKPTIDLLVKKGARIIVLSHYGRPKDGPSDEFSMKFLCPVLQKQWGHPVAFAIDCVGAPALAAAKSLQPGQICLFENVRFHKGEEKNDPAFARELAKNGDIYINDAFSAAHRAHASTEGLAHLMPTGAGLLMQAELNALQSALESPERPLAAIVGGAKISTKIDLLENLVKRTDILVLGGGMANTFLHAKGVDMKASLCERDMAEQARRIMENAARAGCEIVLPVDGVAATQFAANAPHFTRAVGDIPDGYMVLDIGPETVKLIKDKLQKAATIVWNGPLGAFEISPFDAGTVAVAEHVAKLPAMRVAGGGDTVAALEHAHVAAKLDYVSAAGGAFLEWLEGKTLPGVAALGLRQSAA